LVELNVKPVAVQKLMDSAAGFWQVYVVEQLVGVTVKGLNTKDAGVAE
jgi:hypothetical protein